MRTLVGTLPPEPDPIPRRTVLNRRIGLVQFLRGVKHECRRINVPLSSEVRIYSAVTLTCVTTMTVLVGAFDVLVAKGLVRVLTRVT